MLMDMITSVRAAPGIYPAGRHAATFVWLSGLTGDDWGSDHVLIYARTRGHARSKACDAKSGIAI